MAIDPSSLDWAAARRVSYLLRQSFRYEYPEPIHDLNHRLVVIPPERFGDQLRLRHELSVDAESARFEDRKDRFGNVIIDVFAPRVSNAIDRSPTSTICAPSKMQRTCAISCNRDRSWLSWEAVILGWKWPP